METLALNFFISSLLSLLAKHSCQVPHDQKTGSLNPIILMPASSGISYEALHYPVSMEQYQVIPIAINTGKIPLINHAIQAPVQYFIPNNGKLMSNYDSVTYSTPRHKYRSTTQHSPMTHTYTQIENLQTHKEYLPTTINSETGEKGQPLTGYSYGYKIIDSDIGNSNDKNQLMDNNVVTETYRLAEPKRTIKVFEYMANPENNIYSTDTKTKNE